MLSLLVSIYSCQKKEEENKYVKQIEVAKEQLLKLQVSQPELEKYQFTVTEAFDKDVYKMIQKKYEEDVDRDKKIKDFKAAEQDLATMEKYLHLQIKGTGKTFYKVQGVRIAGDTLNNKIVYVDDTDKVIDFHNIR